MKQTEELEVLDLPEFKIYTMITKEIFIKQIELINKYNEFVDKLDDLNINIINSDLYEITSSIFDNFIISYFNNDGQDLIFWWIYESVPKIIYESTIFGEEEINVEDINDFWSYLIGHKEEYFN